MSLNDIIPWSKDYSLKWSDFKAESNPAIYEDSHSFIRYTFTWTIDSDKLNQEIVFLINQIKISVEFHPLLSWVRDSEVNDNLLKHEQGHFDLAEMLKIDYDKILKNRFDEKVFPTRGQNDAQRKQFAKDDSGKMISIEIDKLSKILREKREEYDVETEYGKNILNQSKYAEIFKKIKL
jgi:hypothetical protein|tara:strand:+ start:1314 stop:1850 length:537 start_codon:yes stop_codon:yes gene_type:complete